MLTELKERLSAMPTPRAGQWKGRKRSEKMRDLICVMPDMIEQVRAWSDRPEISTTVRRLYSILLSYVYVPLDLRRDDKNGLEGYLDDAYLTAIVYQHCVAQIGIEKPFTDPRVRDMSVQIQGWLKAVRRVLPQETAKLDAMLKLYLEGDTTAFSDLLAEAEANHRKLAI